MLSHYMLVFFCLLISFNFFLSSKFPGMFKWRLKLGEILCTCYIMKLCLMNLFIIISFSFLLEFGYNNIKNHKCCTLALES